MKCPKQGVGKTETFQARISNYISHIIQQKPTCGIVKHFLYTEGHSVEDFRIMGIVRLEKPPKSPKDLNKMLKEFEGYWKIKLQTLEPYGMNLFDEFTMQSIMTRPMFILIILGTVWGSYHRQPIIARIH